jgi:two-component system NarL family sensor kinase
MEARLGSIISALSRIQWVFLRAGEAAESNLWVNFGWLLTTSLAMIVCYLLNIPNPGVLLLVAVFHSSFVGGWKAGTAAAALSALYSALFLSSPDGLFHYTDPDTKTLIENILGCSGCVALVHHLRRREVTEAKEKEERDILGLALAASERRFHEMADAAPVLLWMSDVNGRRTFFNRQWLMFTGRTAEQQKGDGWQSSMHPDDRCAIARYTAAVKSGDRVEVEYRLRASDGEYRLLQDIGAPWIGQDGRLLGYVGACTDRTERKRVETALHQLSGRLLELQDDERRRIARELHDTTAQNLAVLSMNLHAVSEKVFGSKPRQAVVESLALAERCSQEIRTLSYLLHPPLLDELGLMSALRSYAAGYTQRTGIQVELKMDDIGRLPRDVEITLFRIVQEALTNVHRHSGSPRAEIRVIRDPREVHLHVTDAGRGVPVESLDLIHEGASLGVGIAGMRERARQLGGTLKIASSSGGTTITANLPLRDRM